MPFSFRDAAENRRWQPAACFDLAAHSPFFDVTAWGRRLPAGTDGLPGNVRAHLRVVPEGVSLHAHCSRCGGRHEAVIDFRSLDEVCFGARAVPADFDGFGEDRAQYLEYVLLQQPLRNWADHHLRCRMQEARPGLPELPAAVGDVVRLLQAVAEHDLREFGMAEASAVIVPHEGEPLWLDLDGDDDPARALTAFRVRELTDRERFPEYTMVLAEEVPAPALDASWRMAVVGASGCWRARAGVHRARGLPQGPALLDPPSWSALLDDGDWIDGLRASRTFFPIARPGANQH